MKAINKQINSGFQGISWRQKCKNDWQFFERASIREYSLFQCLCKLDTLLSEHPKDGLGHLRNKINGKQKVLSPEVTTALVSFKAITQHIRTGKLIATYVAKMATVSLYRE